MHKRLKRLYSEVSDEFIRKAIKHKEESEVLISNSHKLEEIIDEESKMYYEEIIYDLGGNSYGKKRNNRKN